MSATTPSFFDASGSFLLYDRVWIGATYRFENSYGLIFQFNVNNQLKFGYSYDPDESDNSHHLGGLG